MASMVLAAALLVSGCTSSGDGAIQRKGPASTTSSLPDSDQDQDSSDGEGGSTSSPTDGPLNGLGSPTSVGDPVTPGAGAEGIDVLSYDLDLNVADPQGPISATVLITVKAEQELAALNLDLHGLTVESATIDDQPVDVSRDGDELSLKPKSPIPQDTEFVAAISYSGDPNPVEDPSAPGVIGWLDRESGSFVAAEPIGTKAFLPSNDHPSDKALFSFTITAPENLTAIANGVLAEKLTENGMTSWRYTQSDPMATYLIQIAVGDYDLIEATGPRGMQIRHAVVRNLSEEQRTLLDQTAAQIEFFETLFGPYPLDTYGLLVADSSPEFALETQTLTLMPASWLRGNTDEFSRVAAHELAHQWYGDSITPSSWSDIWLNESFATYAEWLWADHAGIQPLEDSIEEGKQVAEEGRGIYGPIDDPRPTEIFSINVYYGGGYVLHALRLEIGDEQFFELLRRWAADNAGDNVSTEDFEALAAEITGSDLTDFFETWLRSDSLPALPNK